MPRPPRPALKDPGPQSDLLVVEGPDDFHAFTHFFDAHKIRGRCRLEETGGNDGSGEGGGYERLLGSIDTRVDESELERIGFVVDADENVASRWASLRDTLRSAGYSNAPESPNPAGTIIIQPGRTTVGLWLMPDNKIPGALEDFAKLLIPVGDVLRDHAVTSVADLPHVPKNASDNWKSKACIHTWLAWQQEPGKPIGQAITKRYLDPRAGAALPLLTWLRTLFVLDPAA